MKKVIRKQLLWVMIHSVQSRETPPPPTSGRHTPTPPSASTVVTAAA